MARPVRKTRTYPRYRLPYPVVFGGAIGVGEGVLTTLSMQGCSIRTAYPLVSGSQLRVSLLLPDQSVSLPIEVGIVKWVREDQCGVEFLRVGDESRQRLNRTLRAELIQYFKNRRAERCEEVGAVAPL